MRVHRVSALSVPEDAALRVAGREAGRFGAGAIGLTVGDAVIVRRGHRSRRTLAHEMRHVDRPSESRLSRPCAPRGSSLTATSERRSSGTSGCRRAMERPKGVRSKSPIFRGLRPAAHACFLLDTGGEGAYHPLPFTGQALSRSRNPGATCAPQAENRRWRPRKCPKNRRRAKIFVDTSAGIS